MSEPPSKIDKPDAISRQLHQSQNEQNDVEFFVVLCHDLFFEVLQFGNRLRLTKLENTGRRFFQYIEHYFEKAPFLRLNLCLLPSEDSEKQLKTIIGLWKTGSAPTEISPSDLTALPHFLRFNNVHLGVAELAEESGMQPIADKCLLFEKLLQSVKPALADSELSFLGDINGSKSSCFHDHLELLNYLRDRLLPICNESREYKFDIEFYSDESAAQHVITSILQTQELNHCSSAKFFVYCGFLQLPVEEITNWLNRRCDRDRNKSLYIHSPVTTNFQEMINHLKEGFKHDKFPVPPYTFMLKYPIMNVGIEDERMLINEKTNEEFSVRKTENKEGNTVIIIERSATKKKR